MSDGRKEEVLDLFKKHKFLINPEFSESINDADAQGFGIYNNDKSHRYYLYIDLYPKENLKQEKILTAIMLNPSEKSFYGGFDQTVTYVIKIAREAKIEGKLAAFSSVEVLNLFSYKESNLKKAEKHWQRNETNVKFLNKFLNKFNNPILIAWGNSGYKVDKNNKGNIVGENFKTIIDAINIDNSSDIYAYHVNGIELDTNGKLPTEYRLKPIRKKQPTHPSPFNKQQLNDFFKNPELIPITKDLNSIK